MDKAWTYILAAAAALLGGRAGAAAQGDSTATVPSPQVRLSAPRLRARADSLRRTYRFAEAVELYRQAQEAARDSSVRQALEEDLALARNGLSMSAFCSQPVVVARQRFSLSDFFLFYPLEDKAWRPVPNVLDSLGAASPARAMYVPAGADKLIYSAADEDGIHNLYRTERKDSVWTAPELLGEDHTSPGNEVFPMLSADGKALYFSSAGLYGMGGYDLYVSRWNEETRDWDAPVNLGFPYSSPFDDFLFVNTPDGKYSMFASNRDCSPDSVYLYVLEYDSMPVRKAVSDPEALAGLAALLPEEDPARMDNGAVASSGQDDVDTRRYSEKMASVRALRDSVYACGRGIDRARAALMEAAEEDKAGLAARILADETQLAALQEALAKATKELQDIEMEFLMSGVVIDPEKLQQEADREVVGAASGYVFSRSSMGPALQMTVQRPKPSFDYAFMVLPEGRLDRFRICGTEGEIVSPVEFNQCGEITYTVIRNGVEETKTVTAPNNYALESEQLSLCVLGEAKPHVSKEFSLLTARVTDRILQAIGY